MSNGFSGGDLNSVVNLPDLVTNRDALMGRRVFRLSRLLNGGAFKCHHVMGESIIALLSIVRR